ncbi:MAG: cytochrome c oxidase subunit 3 [Cytophagales bacterium]|nr:cytochrome c oxidase subunit 3 [Cytophagales bacterium]MDW8384703.1 cytochrome c oxidase subunit 3 [Flammeovirgaceae bacterium]
MMTCQPPKKQKTTLVHQLESMHAHQMLLYLFIIGIGLLFSVLLVAFTFTRLRLQGFEYKQFPVAFIISTLLIMSSSWFLRKSRKAFESEKIEQVKHLLGITLLLGISFCATQFLGWLELQKSGIFLIGKASGAYLYLISGLHALHLIGGIIFLFLEYRTVLQMLKDPVKYLILITSPYEKLKIKMLCQYWHFLDALWIFLFVYFLISF